MSKEDVIKKIKEILAKDRRFTGAKVEVIFKDKENKNLTDAGRNIPLNNG